MRKNENEYVKKRKSYYGFAKNYPGKIGSTRYVIGDSRSQQKKEMWRKVLIAVLVVLLFIVTFIITEVCLQISDRPIDNLIFNTLI